MSLYAYSHESYMLHMCGLMEFVTLLNMFIIVDYDALILRKSICLVMMLCHDA